ncbi:MAG: hypothetical protein LBC55_03510, partial [Desulfovibrio sp.]|nr:hypothetical protein [Desulfovibrio sp.]
CEAPFPGDYGAENAAAVAALALSLGLEPDDIRRGLAAAETPAQRFAVRHCCISGRGRYALVDDSYNANPLSAARVIPAAGDAARAGGLPFVPVLGEMLELGEESPAAHERLGEIVAATRPSAVFWTGGQADEVLRGLRRGGLPGRLEELPARAEDFVSRLEAMGPALVLFKGSRANRLERWVEALLRKAGDTAQLTGETAQPAGSIGRLNRDTAQPGGNAARSGGNAEQPAGSTAQPTGNTAPLTGDTAHSAREPRVHFGQRPDIPPKAGDAQGRNFRMRTKGDGRVL